MFEFTNWLRKTFITSYHGFNFASWVQRYFKGARPRSTVYARPTAQRLRPRLEVLEDRMAPSANLPAGSVTINLPRDTVVHVIDTEGQQVLNGFKLGIFHDTGEVSASVFHANITWGDGSSDTVTDSASGPAKIVAGAPAGTWNIVATSTSHIYDELAANTDFSFQVFDGPNELTANHTSLIATQFTDAVVDQPLTAGAFTPPSGLTEGDSVTNLTVFHFTDANVSATPGDFTATVKIGNATLTNTGFPGNVQVVPTGGGGFDVQLTYTFTDEFSAQTFSVSVQDEGSVYVNGFETANSVFDTTNSANGVPGDGITRTSSGTGLLPSAPASGSFFAVAQNTDGDFAPGFGDSIYTFFGGAGRVYLGSFEQSVAIYVNTAWTAPTDTGSPAFWLDMAPNHPPGNYGAEHNFRFYVNGTGSVGVAGDGGSPFATITTTGWYTFEMVFKKDPVPTNPVLTDLNIYDATGAVVGSDLNLPATSPGGPMQSSDLTGNGYAWLTAWQNGFAGDQLAIDNFKTSVLPVSGSTSLSVSDAPLHANAGPTFSLDEGTTATNVVVATFTDANPGDHTADFTTAINWGDGTALDVTGVISYDSGTGVYTVTGTHTYAEEGNFAVTVRITDAGGFAVDTIIGLDATGAVVTAPAQAAGVWYTDRYPPAGFTGGQTDAGRTGVIDQFISSADQDGSRPPAFNSGFYDTQGRKYDLPPGTTFLTMDLYIPSAWSALVQQDPAGASSNYGLLASLWATGVDGPSPSATVTSFPIIAFNNNVAPSTAGAVGFRVFDQTIGYTNVPGFAGYDQWYQLSFGLSPNDTVVYFVNGTLVYTDTTPTGTFRLSNVILQGYNGGNDYHIFWNPVEATPATVNEVDPTINANSGDTLSAIDEGNSTPATAIIGTFTDLGNPTGAFDATQVSTATAEYTVTFDWGDGTTTTVNSFDDQTAFSFDSGTDTFSVKPGAHTYGEEGTFNITMTVAHDAATLQGPTQTDSISVNEVQITGLTGAAATQTIDEGTATTAITGIATFDDLAGAEPNASDPTGTENNHYTATIDWGDGTTEDNLTGGVSVVATGATSLRVDAPAHTYADEGSYTVTVTVKHEGAAVQGPVTGATITVDEVQITGLTGAAATQTIDEGTSTTAITGIATFTDPAGFEPNASDPTPASANAHYTVVIHWGDGSTEDNITGGVNVVHTTGNDFRVDAPAHAYAEEGTYVIDVDVTHETAATLTALSAATITVDEVQLTNFVVAAPSGLFEADNAGPLTVATFTDSAGAEPNPSDPGTIADNYSATIDWGDGSGPHAGTVVHVSGNDFAIQDASHTFDEEGPYTLTVTIQHETATLLSDTDSYTVGDIPVTVDAGSGGTLTAIDEATATSPGELLGTFQDTGNPTGAFDAAVSNLVANGGFETGDFTGWTQSGNTGSTFVSSSTVHGGAFAAQMGPVGSDGFLTQNLATTPGATYVFSFWLDSDGGTPNDFSASFDGVQVFSLADAGGFGYTLHSFTVTASGASTPIEFAFRQDPNYWHLDDVSVTGPEYAVDIDWGDGAHSTVDNIGGGVVYSGGTTFSVLSPGHTYAEEGNYTISLSVAHDALSATAPVATATIAVNDVAVSLVPGPHIFFANEGAPLTGVTVATFFDAGNPSGTLDGTGTEYSATIDWGDGHTDTVDSSALVGDGIYLVSAGPGGSTWQIVGSHTYAEEEGSPFAIQVSVTHDALAPTLLTQTASATVSDVALTSVAPGANSSQPEGASTLITLATFKDPGNPTGNLTETGEYSADVNWGDGNSELNVPLTITYSGGVNGTFTVKASHTYIEESNPTYTVTVQLHHETTTDPTPVLFTVTVTDPAVVATAGPSFNGSEGVNSGLVFLGTFTDPGNPFPGPQEAPSEYQVRANWGDSVAIDTTPLIFVGGGGVFFMFGNHTYAEEGGYTVTVTVRHFSEGAPTFVDSTPVTLSANVGDQQITNVTASGVPSSISEGGSTGAIATIATFTDPAGQGSENAITGDTTATINWGDGSSSAGTVTFVNTTAAGANYNVASAGHTYTEEGSYNVTVTLQHDAMVPVTTAVQTITITEVPVVVTPAASFTATEGQLSAVQPVATFTDPAGAEPLTSYSALINWGDATPATVGTITVSGTTFTVSGQHLYAEESAGHGPFKIVTTVTHETATTIGANTLSAAVADAPVSTPVVSPISATEGAPTGPITGLAIFSDTGGQGSETASDFSVSINWGDATTPDVVTPVALGGGLYRVDAPTHTYVEEGARTITVSVTHEALSAVSGSVGINVADPSVVGASAAPFTRTEGESFTGQTVATFTDPGHNEAVEFAAHDYTATIDWGDGTATSSGAITLGGTTFTVKGDHIYAEEGVYTVRVTLHHDSATDTVVTTSATVSDVQLTSLATSSMPTGKLEGAATGAITNIAQFTDPAGAELPGDYTATINWGDGNTSPGTIVSDGGGVFHVDAPSHTYAEEGTFTVNVTLKHDALATITTPGQTIIIADQQITVANGPGTLPTGYLEGQTVSSTDLVGLFTITDPAGLGAENLGDYSATILWGDGTTSPGTIVAIGAPPGTYVVNAPSHVYTEDGIYTVSLRARHDLMPDVSFTGLPITIGAAPLANLTVSPVSAVENTPTGPITGLATFTDTAGVVVAGDTFTASINWGDLSTPDTGTVVSLGGGLYRIDAPSHTYIEESGTPYTITLTVTHDGTPVVGTSSATVADVQLTSLASANLPSSGNEGASIGAVTGIASFTDPAGVGNETIADFSATINWGDGNTSSGTVVSAGSGNYTVNAPAHIYAEEGTYTVNVTIKHDLLPALTTPNQTITVADQQLTSLATSNMPTGKLEGAATGVITNIAQFTDPAGAEPLGDYTATINWGDGNTSPGTIVSDGGGVFHVDAPSHTYAEEGNYNVNVTLKHDALANVTTPTKIFAIADQQITTPVAANLPANGLEGVALPTILGIATFTDPAGAGVESTADFSATINWGDLTTSPGQIVSLGGGAYSVNAPAHTYVEESTYIVTVTVQHESLTALTSNTLTIVIADQQLTNLTSANLPTTGLEGQGVGAITGIAGFVDPAGVGTEVPAVDFTATINWGDSSTSTGTVVSQGGGNYTVNAPTHTYAEEGTYTVNVTLTHGSLSSQVTPNQTIVIADQQLTSLATSTMPTGKLEGAGIGAIANIAQFTDPAGVGVETASGDFTATINWGDGNTSPGTIISDGVGNYHVSAPDHTYVEEGSYTVNVTLKHDALPTVTTPNRTIVIADQQLTSLTSANLPANGVEGQAISAITGIATFNDPAGVGLETTSDFTATINWGDLTTSPGTVVSLGGGNYRVDAPAHTYADEGPYTVNVTLTHDLLSSVTTPDQSISIADADLTAGALTPPATSIGVPFTDRVLFHFTDANPLATAADFSALITWGDTTTSTVTSTHSASGQIVASGGGFDVLGSHTYTSQVQNATFSVAVTDHPKTASASTTINVSTFHDDFNRANSATLGAPWITQTGTFGISANTAVPSTSVVSLATVSGVSLTNVIVQADVSISAIGGDHADLISRYSGPGQANYYQAMIMYNAGAGAFQTSMWVNQGGNYMSLASPANLAGFTGTGTMRMEQVGNQLKLFVNNILRAVAYDSTLTTAGLVGIRGQGASFDNFDALSVTPTTTGLPFTDTFTKPNNSDLGTVWTERIGAFTTQSNQAADATNLATVSLATLNTTTAVADTIVQADVTVPAVNMSHADLVARFVDMNHYYQGMIIFTGGAYQASMWVNNNGTYMQLASASMTGFSGTGNLRIEVVGKQLKLFVNNVLKAIAYDTTIAAPGLVGIRGGNGSLDNFNASAVPTSSTTLGFTDTFTKPDNSDLDRVWTERAGAYSIQSNKAADAISLASVSLATLNTTSVANVHVQADVAVGNIGGSHADLIARYAGPDQSNYYQAMIFFSGSGYTASIWLNQNGNYSMLGSLVPLTGFSGSGTLRFEVVGNSLKLFVDNVLKVSATDSTLASGLVGIRSNNSTFDNFNVN